LEESGIATRWDVITGGEKFFHITKAFHNALHGAPYEGPPDWFDEFLATNEENRQRMEFDEDFVVIHDPQPVALVTAREKQRGRWIWRCHIDLSRPSPVVWDFLRPWVEKYDASLFSSPLFTRGLSIPQYQFFPTIDPLADKNRESRAGICPRRSRRFRHRSAEAHRHAISRFDRSRTCRRHPRLSHGPKVRGLQLVLAGGSASDDPEGMIVLREVEEAAAADPDIHF